MNTPLQNALGHLYGPGRTVETDGMFPVWLEQDGSSIMGGIIDLQHTYTGSLKVVDVFPDSIRTGTPCYKKTTGEYIPIPTYRVVKAVSASDTEVILANWDGCAKLKSGMKLDLPSDTSKNITTSSSNLAADSDGNYKLTITANLFGVLAPGDCLVLDSAAGWAVKGLTKSNLDYKGADPTSKLNVTLVDRGRILENVAPVTSKAMKEKLQTVKYEED